MKVSPKSAGAPGGGANGPSQHELMARYGRKRCDNCGAWFPLTRPKRRFCKDECKDEFHYHGSAFGPLKIRLEKLVANLAAEAITPKRLAAAGFVHRSQLKTLVGRVKDIERKLLHSNLVLDDDAAAISSTTGEPSSASTVAAATKWSPSIPFGPITSKM